MQQKREIFQDQFPLTKKTYLKVGAAFGRGLAALAGDWPGLAGIDRDWPGIGRFSRFSLGNMRKFARFFYRNSRWARETGWAKKKVCVYKT